MNGMQLYDSVKGVEPECRGIFVIALGIAQELISILLDLKESCYKKAHRQKRIYSNCQKSTAQSEQ